jgi:hypothetical protein
MNMNNDKPSPENGQTTGPSRRTIAARENGSEGGRKRASQFSWDVLSEWASHGGKAVLAKYGPDCFAGLRKRGKNYPKLNESPVVEPNWRRSWLGKMARRVDWHVPQDIARNASGSGDESGGLKPGSATAEVLSRDPKKSEVLQEGLPNAKNQDAVAEEV